MKRRIYLAGGLLIIGYSILILISGAPWRVHVAHGLTWLPTILAGCSIYWSARLSCSKKIVLIALVIALGAFLATYAGSWVIMKAEVNFTAHLASAFLLTVGTAALVGLTSLLGWIFGGKL